MPGVIYIQTVPPLFTVKKLREIMSKFGELGRVYLQAEKRGPRRRKRYTEGWIEFKSKQVAKEVAQQLNGHLVGAASGKRRSAAYDSMWTMKYLHGFKWDHLMEQLAYERRVEQQRLRTEIVQERRKADHFSHQVEKGERLKQLEEKILKKCGLWDRMVEQRQRKVVDEARKKERSREMNGDETFLRMIFGDDGGDGREKDGEDEEEMRMEEEEEDEREEEDAKNGTTRKGKKDRMEEKEEEDNKKKMKQKGVKRRGWKTPTDIPSPPTASPPTAF